MLFMLAALVTAKLPLVVRTYDSAGVAPPVLEHAQAVAGITLAAAGIEPVWHPCHATTCIGPPKPHEVELRLVNATAFSEHGSLGFAAVDMVARAGTLATVYVDRVDALAAAAGVEPDELLGRAIAHEIGHLLLGSVDHSRFGLMRATWTANQVRRNMPLDWIFSEAQAREMRGRLAEAEPVVLAASRAISDRPSAQ